MVELLHEYGAITNIEDRTTKTGKKYWDIELNGKKFRSWNDPELAKMDKGRLSYRPQQEGTTFPPTAIGFILGDGLAPQEGRAPVEEVLDTIPAVVAGIDQARLDKMLGHNKIKTVVADTATEFDNLVNDFCSKNKVFATQTHIQPLDTEGTIIMTFSAVMFYR